MAGDNNNKYCDIFMSFAAYETCWGFFFFHHQQQLEGVASEEGYVINLGKHCFKTSKKTSKGNFSIIVGCRR